MNWREFIKNHEGTVQVPKIKAASSGFAASRVNVPSRGSSTLLAMLK